MAFTRVLLNYTGRVQSVLDALENGTIQRAALRSVRTQVVQKYRAVLKENVARTTITRTGLLKRTATVKSRYSGRGANTRLDIRSDFPRTKFQSARRSGQWAYVLNATPRANPRAFVEKTKADPGANAYAKALLRAAVLREIQKRSR